MSVTSVVEDAGKAVMKAVGVQPEASERDLLDTLKSEHDEVKALLKDLENAETAAERKALVESIKEALIPHAKAEEKVLYAADHRAAGQASPTGWVRRHRGTRPGS